jgi:hypothetical protein
VVVRMYASCPTNCDHDLCTHRQSHPSQTHQTGGVYTVNIHMCLCPVPEGHQARHLVKQRSCTDG